jgi:hypothetical protein
VAVPIGALPVIGSGTAGGTINVPAGSAANLFPQIGPSATPSAKPGTGRSTNQDQSTMDMSSVGPISLSGSEFGSQVIGLTVLLLGIAVFAVGISIRKVRPVGKPSV